ncbi:type VI secretion system-associated protein TagF [Microbulbifer sp. 2205BS26-8]|uniref:type VI secretion system-associated protein TagF n=1 Tax=Microbulbifer sp. 2205BS26-8 TaxID=3064386 RepID=UPI0027401CBE|nr:type VI secretion system-associated protein TagF [Microbulbifer sp. 2205BS26-8]MDP5208185.1 type VI secretion system-associated protein TagF [Microbulbifer sp. 2205BS26-8]
MSGIGLFGKLPGHGDFIQRQLPGSFVDVWDAWLQSAVRGSREIMGQQWLDYYLTSPIWHFVHGKGVIDESAWAGILVPSVDSVGRYFPLTIATALSPKVDAFAFLSAARQWYQSLSELAVSALQNRLHVDQLFAAFVSAPEGIGAASECRMQSEVYVASGDVSGVESSYGGLLGQICQRHFSCYSLWWCEGSQHLAPTSLLCPTLPTPESYCAMLGAGDPLPAKQPYP